jgi:hypothetical protein
MHTQNINRNPNTEEQDGFCTIDHVALQLKALEKFVSRRFDEISMEINATSQQLDMNENDTAKKFSQVMETLGAISYSGSGDTQANQGVELEAVIAETSNAATKIMDAAELISRVLEDDSVWNGPKKREASRGLIRAEIEKIFVACSFQDLAGQRIRNTLSSLQEIEDRIGSTFQALGITVQPNEAVMAEKTQARSKQDEIDALFS